MHLYGKVNIMCIFSLSSTNIHCSVPGIFHLTAYLVNLSLQYLETLFTLFIHAILWICHRLFKHQLDVIFCYWKQYLNIFFNPPTCFSLLCLHCKKATTIFYSTWPNSFLNARRRSSLALSSHSSQSAFPNHDFGHVIPLLKALLWPSRAFRVKTNPARWHGALASLLCPLSILSLTHSIFPFSTLPCWPPSEFFFAYVVPST